MTNEGSDMGGRTWDCVRDILVKIRCPHDSGVGIYAHSFAYMGLELFGLLFMTWGDVI